MNKKQQKRFIELLDKQENTLTHDEFLELQELKFVRNKENIHVRLTGDNKYYFAHQCHKFKKNLKKQLSQSSSDWDKRLLERLEKSGICFNKHSINIGYNQYCEDYKRFSSPQEMLGFVCGFNRAMEGF
tara:strand:+ start:1497 stop:1883 length:387 start_codon:yes stop_codon:yes gene_type:complete